MAYRSTWKRFSGRIAPTVSSSASTEYTRAPKVRQFWRGQRVRPFRGLTAPASRNDNAWIVASHQQAPAGGSTHFCTTARSSLLRWFAPAAVGFAIGRLAPHSFRLLTHRSPRRSRQHPDSHRWATDSSNERRHYHRRRTKLASISRPSCRKLRTVAKLRPSARNRPAAG